MFFRSSIHIFIKACRSKVLLASVFLLLFNGVRVAAQYLDSLPFHTANGLMIVRGSVNGTETDFILDTGAGITVTTNGFNAKAGLKAIGKEQKVRDANDALAKLKQVRIESLKLAKFSSGKMQVVTFDMPFMDCHNFQLLGQDFMHSLNWKFDFLRNMVYVSDQPFSPTDGAVAWNLSYQHKRPFVTLHIGGQTHPALIDFGYRGVLDVGNVVPFADAILQEKTANNEVLLYKARVMGLTTTREAVPVSIALLDSITVGTHTTRHVPVSIGNYKGVKLGLHFFTGFAQSIIFNYGMRMAYFTPREKPEIPEGPFDAGIIWQDGRLLVSELHTGPFSSANDLKMGEEIVSIDGLTATDLTSACEVLRWKYANTKSSVVVEKKDGTKITLLRNSPLRFKRTDASH